jgi:hypothetical protein
MTDEQIVAIIIGTLAPLLIAVVQRRDWPDEVRYGVALAVYLGLTVLTYFFQNETSLAGLGWRDFIRLFAPMFIAGVTAFQLLWKRTAAPVIEEKTTPGS